MQWPWVLVVLQLWQGRFISNLWLISCNCNLISETKIYKYYLSLFWEDSQIMALIWKKCIQAKAPASCSFTGEIVFKSNSCLSDLASPQTMPMFDLEKDVFLVPRRQMVYCDAAWARKISCHAVDLLTYIAASIPRANREAFTARIEEGEKTEANKMSALNFAFHEKQARKPRRCASSKNYCITYKPNSRDASASKKNCQ